MVIGEVICLIILKDRGNLKYFMRGYENDAYNSVMEWLDKKK